MDRDPFQYNRILLEEALKRHEQGLKSTQKGSQIMLERGEMELKYSKMLCDWSTKTRKIIEQDDFESCEAIRSMYLDTVHEADVMSRMHVDIFYALRDQFSPFEKLYSITRNRDFRLGRKIDCTKIATDLKKANELRRSLHENESRWERIRDRYIKEMKQLAETEMTSNVGRQAKLQSLEAEISATQEKIENARKRYNLASKRRQDFLKSQAQVFEEMYGDMEVVERDRLNCTIDAFKRFHKIFSTTESTEWRKSLANRNYLLEERTKAVDVEKILTSWLEQREDNARKAINQPTRSLMSILFDRNPALRRRHDEFGSDMGPRVNIPFNQGETPLRYCESLVTRPDPIRVRPGQRKSKSEAMESEHSVIEAFYSPDSSSECLFAPENNVTQVTVTPGILTRTSQDSDSVPTIGLDGGTSVHNVPSVQSSVPTSPIEFCASENSSRRSSDVPVTLGTSQTVPRRETPSPVEYGHNVDAVESEIREDVSNMIDVKVKAIRDFTSQEPGTLPFHKGQMIKQKIGKNSEGFSYGWTRTSRFNSKTYGFYPCDYVSLPRKSS